MTRTMSCHPRIIACGTAGLLTALMLSGCGMESETAGEPAADNASRYDVQIRWTSYGIPHVKADDWGSLGYGFAYATASNAFCTIARDVVLVNGELARYFGSDAGNLASDVAHRALLDERRLSAMRAAHDTNGQAFSAGYVAGYNRYLGEHRDSLPRACAGEPWVREIDQTDMDRLAIGVGIRYGLGNFFREMANAAPPGQPVAALDSEFGGPVGFGSNAVAMGSALTASGRGLLLGNPHYPWQGASRFHMIHTTIPGEVDVMGVSLYNTDRIAIGFNADVAWTHTVSTGLRATFYQLELEPGNPLRYRYGDEWRDMEPLPVTLMVRHEDGALQEQTETVYMTHYGPVLSSNQFPWTDELAFAVRDTNLDNTRAAETYNAIHRARSIEELDAALQRQGIAWVNTVAADRHGNAYYADVSAVPNIDANLLAACDLTPPGSPAQLVLLNGSDPACEWREDERAGVPGLMPAADMPRLQRQDFVHNANDSYWLSNPDHPLEGFSPVIGSERSPVSLRTRAGLNFIAEELAADEPMTPEVLQDLLFSHRNFAAELLLDDLLVLCRDHTAPVSVDGDAVDVSEACGVLADWDRAARVDSRGAHVWREFWRQAQRVENRWRVPFDATDPANTPRGLNTDDAAVREALLQALAQAQHTLTANNIALDAPLGDIQFEVRNGERIPIPGGEGWAGMWSMIVSQLQPDLGYTPIIHGNSYIQVVSWDEDGHLDPRGILTYSQSDNPASPHYADQTQRYAQGEWIRLPFHEADILADPNLRIQHLRE